VLILPLCTLPGFLREKMSKDEKKLQGPFRAPGENIDLILSLFFFGGRCGLSWSKRPLDDFVLIVPEVVAAIQGAECRGRRLL
jgi:hypothetical protein